jgi:hypothetical protein
MSASRGADYDSNHLEDYFSVLGVSDYPRYVA